MKKYTKKTIDFYNKNIDVYTKNGAVVLKNKIDRFIELLPGKKVLDVACGPGHDADYLIKKGLDCLGIDLSKKMIGFAKKNYQGRFKIMDFFDLDFRKKLFDGIWCSSALIHVRKNHLTKLLENFKKILGKNGVLGIITPKKQKRTQRENDIRIFTMFDKKEIEEYLKIVDFKILRSQTFSFRKMKWLFVLSKKSD